MPNVLSMRAEQEAQIRRLRTTAEIFFQLLNQHGATLCEAAFDQAVEWYERARGKS